MIQRQPDVRLTHLEGTFQLIAFKTLNQLPRAKTLALWELSGRCRLSSGSWAAILRRTRAQRSPAQIADIPTTHNARFAPVIHPTLETGVEGLVVASDAWLSP